MNIYSKHTEDQVLTIYLEGAIDSVNAPEAEALVMACYQAQPVSKIVLDAEKLTYISSSGLRILLKLCKMEKNVKMINVSSEVYEILDITGFVDILSVSRALRTIDVEGCPVLGEGGHGKVVRLDGDTIVKLYRSGEDMAEVEREQEYAKKAFLLGIPTAIPFDIVKCGDQMGLVFELVNADTLTNHLNHHPEQLQEYAVKYANVLKELHKVHVPAGTLNSTKELYRERIEGLHAYLTEEEVALVHRINDAIPDGDTIVHGDFHPRNVMLQNGELVLIDMADLTMGHPLYDLGSMALTHHITGDARIENITQMKASAVRELWKIFLVNYLETEDPMTIEMTVKKASTVALMKMITAVAFSAGARMPGVMEPLIAMVRQNLLSNAEGVIKLLSM